MLDENVASCGHTSCVDCDCIDLNEKEESEVVEVASNTEPVDEVASVADVIPTDVDYVSLLVQPTYEETFMQTLPMSGRKCQVKPIRKVAYCLCTVHLLAVISQLTTIEEAWSGRDANEW